MRERYEQWYDMVRPLTGSGRKTEVAGGQPEGFFVSEVDSATMPEAYVSEVGTATMPHDDVAEEVPGAAAPQADISEQGPDDTMRLEVLKLDEPGPFSFLSTAWAYAMLVAISLILLVGVIRHFGNRVDSIEKQRSEETMALSNTIESKQDVIDQLKQNIERQAQSLREVVEVPTLQLAPRATLPASLEDGQALLIIASTPDEETAVELAQALELDGHASEVVRGMTGQYGVAVGRFEFKQAESMRTQFFESGAAKSMPYLMIDTMIDAYVYP